MLRLLLFRYVDDWVVDSLHKVNVFYSGTLFTQLYLLQQNSSLKLDIPAA